MDVVVSANMALATRYAWLKITSAEIVRITNACVFQQTRTQKPMVLYQEEPHPHGITREAADIGQPLSSLMTHQERKVFPFFDV